MFPLPMMIYLNIHRALYADTDELRDKRLAIASQKIPGFHAPGK